MTDQMSEVSESLGVLEPGGFSAVTEGPILALLAKDPFWSCNDFGHLLAVSSRLRSSSLRLRCHLNFSTRFPRNFWRIPYQRHFALRQPVKSRNFRLPIWS